MKKKIFLVLIPLVIVIFGIKYFHDKYSYANQQEFFSQENRKEDGLKIGIIGDSWVVRQDLSLLVKEKLAEKGKTAQLISSGNPGAKTKLIYENLFKNENEDFSSKKVIKYQPKYCIVIAGVNDAATRAGSKFYSYHMLLIIKTLLHYNIKPIIVTLPKFGIDEDYRQKQVLAKLANTSSEFFLNKENGFEIMDYRGLLLRDLRKNRLEDAVVLVDFDKVTNGYEKDRNLFSDPLHLSKLGYDKLSEFLASKIIDLENKI
jgi:lysophospholipase L1-like esterase